MRFRGGEFSTGTKGNFQSELTFRPSGSPWVVFLVCRGSALVPP